jgi:hypothetical protein
MAELPFPLRGHGITRLTPSNIGEVSALNGLRVMLVVSLVFVGLGFYELYGALRKIISAVPIEATVTDHEVRRRRATRSNDHDSFTPLVEFKFMFNGQTVTSNDIYPGAQTSYGSRAAAQFEISEWPLGSRVTAYVPPHDPPAAFLRKVPSGMSLVALFVPIAMLVASLMYLVQVDRLYVYERRFAFCVALPLAFLVVLGGASLAWTIVVEGQSAAKVALWIATVVLTFAVPLWVHMAAFGQLEEIAPDDLA